MPRVNAAGWGSVRGAFFCHCVIEALAASFPSVLSKGAFDCEVLLGFREGRGGRGVLWGGGDGGGGGVCVCV